MLRRKLLTRIVLILVVISLLSTSLYAAADPLTSSVKVPEGQTVFSIDLRVNEATPYAGIQFALTISGASSVGFASYTAPIGTYSPNIQMKDGKYHFGFSSSASVDSPAGNSIPAGERSAGILNFTGYTGNQALTIEIVQMKVIRIDANKQTYVTEKESPSHVFSVSRLTSGAVPASVSVTVSPESIKIPQTGSEKATATAVVRDAANNILAGQTVSWTLDMPYPGVSIDSSTGVVTVTAYAESGKVIVVGSCGAASGTDTLTLTKDSGGGGVTPGGPGGPGGPGDPDVTPGGDTPGDTEEIPDTGPPMAYRFIDVMEPGLWYYDAVYYLYEYGVMEGTGGDRFSPDITLTRGTFVTILGRLAEKSGEITTGFENPFNDVKDGIWYTQYVAWGAAKGIVLGHSETTFAPNAPVTREQMAALLVRYADYMEIELKDDIEITFSDAGSIHEWAREDVARATAAGLMQGNQGRFRPLATGTRAEVAQLFMNFIINYIE